MKFRIERDAFADAVTWVARTLPTRPSRPVLAGILIHTSATGIALSSFDAETAAQVDVEATVAEEGRVLVPGRLLGDIARSLPAQPVEFAVEGSRVQVTCGRSSFTLPTLPVDEYPALPEMPSASGSIPGASFASAVSQVAIAAGRDDALPFLTGIRIEIDDTRVTLVATDRYRLAVREFNWVPATPGLDVQALAPAKTLADTAKSLANADTVNLGVSAVEPANLLGFDGHGRRPTARLLDAGFPDYRALLPKESISAAIINTAALIDSVKRVALVAERNTPLKMSFSSNEVVLRAGTGDEAQASEVLECTLEGPDIEIALNPHYLLDGLGVLDSASTRMSFTVPEKPVVITPATDDAPNFHYLLMPVRLAG